MTIDDRVSELEKKVDGLHEVLGKLLELVAGNLEPREDRFAAAGRVFRERAAKAEV